MRVLKAVLVLIWFWSVSAPALAQSSDRVEIALQVGLLRLTGPDATDSGVGGRVSWTLTRAAALEAVADFFPTGAGNVPRGGRRLHALAGPRVGWRTDRVGVFAKARVGVARVSEGRQNGGCILIFPPPEACYTADSRLAFDIGGGFEVYPSPRSSVRLDVGSLVTHLGQMSARFGQTGDFARDFTVTGSVGVRF
jgi:hypothetical protein